MAKFYISDTHFSHDNILRFEEEARPFKTVQDHDEYLIHCWNERVAKDDLVYHLGDVCFKPKTQLDRIMPRLNGRKILIAGNHDTRPACDYLEWFEDVRGCMADPKLSVIFTHIPVHPSQLEDRYEINVHGHIHSQDIENSDGCPDPRYINVSCDRTGLYPVHEDVLSNIIEAQRDIISARVRRFGGV